MVIGSYIYNYTNSSYCVLSLCRLNVRLYINPVRQARNREYSVCNFRDYGLDEEDFEMFGLALKRLKEDKDELVDGVPWAYYPSDILLLCIYVLYMMYVVY